MAVYFEPQRKPWYEGPLSMLAGTLLNNALQRTDKAKQFEYEQKLIADQDARKVAEAQRQEAVKRGYLDQAAAGIRNNPHQLPGSADFIPGMVGAGANMQHLQNYWIPQQEQIDLGGTKLSRPIFPDGQGGEGQSFGVTMTPQQIGMMDIAKQELALKEQELALKESFGVTMTPQQIGMMDIAKQELALKEQELALKDWKTRQEAAQGWAGVSNANRNANSPHYTMNGDYVDANGNVVMIDTKTGAVKTLPGIVKRPGAPVAQQNPMVNAKLASEIYKNVTGIYPSPQTLAAGDPIYKYILANIGIGGQGAAPTPGVPTNPNAPMVVPKDTLFVDGKAISPQLAAYMKYRPGITAEQAMAEMKAIEEKRKKAPK